MEDFYVLHLPVKVKAVLLCGIASMANSELHELLQQTGFHWFLGRAYIL
jgi:hypothetical protein